ncbi:unnamed protein product [Mesocestoides corti]|uniref:Uncharacterized protein n=1 Tax=Mesocestoides corti TaxID=53468 RepID=A0A0R3UCY9_MESCO|nr:unnamed protein product [Mesocestoides corti]VDD78901.1 unnamed protein product [Mesocestoides corti]
MNASVTRFSRLGPHHLPLRVHVQSDQPPQPPHRRPTSLKPASMTQPLPTHSPTQPLTLTITSQRWIPSPTLSIYLSSRNYP